MLERSETQPLPQLITSEPLSGSSVGSSAAMAVTAPSKTSILTPQTATPLRIPGFDPSRYGKLHPSPLGGKLQPVATVESLRKSSASTATGIHSPAATFSTLDDSGPVTPQLTSSLPPPEDTSALPLVTLQPISTRPQSPVFQDSTWSTSKPENSVVVQASVEVPADRITEVSQPVTVSSHTQVALSPVKQHPHCRPEFSPQPRAQARPQNATPLSQASSMHHNMNFQHQIGRPMPASNASIGQETQQQKLQRLKLNELNAINRRNRRKDRDQTASPATLSALRLPLPPDQERKIASQVQRYHDLGSVSPQDQRQINHQQGSYAELSLMSALRPSAFAFPSPQPAFRNTEEASLSPRSITRKDSTPVSHRNRKSTDKSSDYYIPGHAKAAQPNRNPRWVSNADVKADKDEADSNAWGSDDLNEAPADSDDSNMAIHHGDINHKRAPPAEDTGLAGWDGKLQPPPVDWNDRPRFDNNRTDFKEAFNSWAEAGVDRMVSPSPDMSFDVVDSLQMANYSLQPDGIGMIPRQTTITSTNVDRYGYSGDIGEALRESNPLTRQELTQVTVLDTCDPANEPILEETTEEVVQRWLVHNNINFDSLIKANNLVPSIPKERKHRKREPNPNSPNVSIYLRPAVKSDIPQMTQIYNWYVGNSARTAEYDQVPESDLRDRLQEITAAKLPFVVAVMKMKRRDRRGDIRQMNGTANNSNQDPILDEEKIAGWACAQDFTATDYVERISVELEIYVAHDMRHQGVGKCLMDKLMDACDRGHLKMGGYDFDCAPEKNYLFNSGGGRDLHKLYFILRHWSFPRKGAAIENKGKAPPAKSTNSSLEASEDEYGVWLKAWLEKWNFNVEGTLKQAGAKNGRYLDVIHLGRETFWQPPDGQIPDALPGTE